MNKTKSQVEQQSAVKYESHFVAFVDILGFAAWVKRTKQKPELLPQLLDAFRIVQEESISSSASFRDFMFGFLDDLEKDGEIEPDECDRVKRELFQNTLFAFSDSIVLTNAANPEGLKNLLERLVGLTLKLLDLGIFVRGGLALGEIYHDSSTIVGPGLIEAYEIEREIAIYPRIAIPAYVLPILEVCHDAIIERGGGSSDLSDITEAKAFIRQDLDGVFFLDFLGKPAIDNYLSRSLPSAEKTAGRREKLKQVRRSIVRNMELSSQKEDVGKMKIRAKMMWLAEYYNKTMKQYRSLKLDPINSRSPKPIPIPLGSDSSATRKWQLAKGSATELDTSELAAD